MKRLILFVKMIFIYPVIFFSSLHVLKSDFELKYAVLSIWAKTLLKLSQTRVELIHKDLIPLENGYVFVSSHDSTLDSLCLIHSLPVSTRFIFDQTEKVPYLSIWFKRIKTKVINYTQGEDLSRFNLRDYMGQHNLTLFNTNIKKNELNPQLLEQFYTEKLTLIPVLIEGNTNILKRGRFNKVKVKICLPLHFEEYQELSPVSCLNELNARIEASKGLI